MIVPAASAPRRCLQDPARRPSRGRCQFWCQ